MFVEVKMTADDFRRIALSFEGAEESSHMGVPDFRVGGRIFATLASQDDGFGNLKLTPELQQLLIAESPDVFLPIKGGWGRMGMTPHSSRRGKREANDRCLACCVAAARGHE